MDETDCAAQLQAARAEVDSLKEERDAAIAATDAALVRMSEERGIMDSNVRAAEARATHLEERVLLLRIAIDDVLGDTGHSDDSRVSKLRGYIAAKAQAVLALADCQRELRLQQPTIELPDKHPLRIRAEQAESALTTLRADHARAVEALREVKQLITDLPDAANDSAVAIGERQHFEYVAASIIDTALGVQS